VVYGEQEYYYITIGRVCVAVMKIKHTHELNIYRKCSASDLWQTKTLRYEIKNKYRSQVCNKGTVGSAPERFQHGCTQQYRLASLAASEVDL
jgi:hypothetical protein